MVLLAEVALGATVLIGAGSADSDGRSAHLTVGDSDQARHTAQRITGEFDTAIAAVVEFWGTDWPRSIPIEVTATPERFEDAVGGADVGAFSDVAAVAVATWVDPGRGVAEGQRIVFAAGADTMSQAGLRMVLRHELFHFAARAHTALDAPLLLTEGTADYVARPPSPPAVVTTRLPVDADFAGPEPGRSEAYDAAWSFASFIADSYSPEILRALYVSAAGPDRVALPDAFRQVLGVEPDQLVDAWIDWQRAAT